MRTQWGVSVMYNHVVINNDTKGGNAMAKVMTPSELALELAISPKTLRGWLRKNHTRPVNVKNTSWALDAKTCASARNRPVTAIMPG